MSDRAPSKWQERLASPLTWHIAGVALLAVLVVVLAAQLGMDWAATNGNSTDALAGKQVQLKALEMQTTPLRGLDQRVKQSREQMNKFYAERIPMNYSRIATRIGELEVNSGVRLTRVLYTQGAPTGDLTEISLDCGVSGEYPQIMRFVNGLERDRTFFVIKSMTLAGQQGGLVNLRLSVRTWLRAADAASSGLPTKPQEPVATPAVAGQEGQ